MKGNSNSSIEYTPRSILPYCLYDVTVHIKGYASNTKRISLERNSSVDGIDTTRNSESRTVRSWVMYVSGIVLFNEVARVVPVNDCDSIVDSEPCNVQEALSCRCLWCWH